LPRTSSKNRPAAPPPPGARLVTPLRSSTPGPSPSTRRCDRGRDAEMVAACAHLRRRRPAIPVKGPGPCHRDSCPTRPHHVRNTNLVAREPRPSGRHLPDARGGVASPPRSVRPVHRNPVLVAKVFQRRENWRKIGGKLQEDWRKLGVGNGQGERRC